MSDEIVPRPPARGRRRLFQPGQSGNPAGGRRGSRNKATLAAATLLDGEALGLTRRAVEAALAGDMLAMKLCLERVLPRCHERPVYETFVRTAGTAKEKVARGNLLQILTAGDEVGDEDEDIGDAEAIDDCDPSTAPADGCRRDNSSKGPHSTQRKNPPVDFLQMQEAEIALCNSWLIVRKAARGSPTARRQSPNRRRGAIGGWPS